VIKSKALKNQTRWIYLLVLFVCLQSFFVSSVYGVDFSCPGGQWVLTSSTFPMCSLYSYGYTQCPTIEGDTQTINYYLQTSGSDCRIPGNTSVCWANCVGCIPLITSLPHDCLTTLSTCTYFAGQKTYKWQCPAVCTAGQTKPCPYTGPAGTENVGECKAGTQTCVNGQWGACVGEVLPQAEICGNDKDENCDGQKDEGCCGYTIPNVPSPIPQCDTRWPNIKYDNTQKTICKKGCAMSSLTMLMNSMGCYTDLLTVNGCSECFVGAGSVDWEKILGAFCPSVSYIDSKTFSKDAPQPFKQFIDPVQLKQDMKNGYRYILWVKSPTGSQCGHFVFLKGISEDCNKLEVIDPANTYTAITKICGYRKFK